MVKPRGGTARVNGEVCLETRCDGVRLASKSAPGTAAWKVISAPVRRPSGLHRRGIRISYILI